MSLTSAKMSTSNHQRGFPKGVFKSRMSKCFLQTVCMYVSSHALCARDSIQVQVFCSRWLVLVRFPSETRSVQRGRCGLEEMRLLVQVRE